MGDNKKVHHVELIPSEQLLAVISGRNRHVRLLPMVGLDGRDTDSFKLLETKGCQLLTSGKSRHGSHMCLCVAMKRQVICYELNKSKARHQRLREIQVSTSTRVLLHDECEQCGGKLVIILDNRYFYNYMRENAVDTMKKNPNQ